jgi:hypothetical protein
MTEHTSIAARIAITHGPAGEVHWHASDPRARQELTTAGFAGIAAVDALLTLEQNRNNVLIMFQGSGRRVMLKIFVEEAAALASITLFVGMIAVWAQLIPQF